MFKAIQRADHARLRALAEGFIRTENHPAALLCLDHIFSHFPKLAGLSLAAMRAFLSLYLEYVRLLDKLWRDDPLAKGSKHQKLFGFRILGEDRYLVPKHTRIHEILTKQSGSGEETVDGYVCAYGDLSWGIIQFISNRICDRTELQNRVCRDVHGFSPCLTLIVRGQCKWGQSCGFQHTQSDHLTVEWYHTRIRLVLLQLQILNSARYYPWSVTKYVFVHSE